MKKCARCGTSDGSTGKLTKFIGNIERGSRLHCEVCIEYMMRTFNLDSYGNDKERNR